MTSRIRRRHPRWYHSPCALRVNACRVCLCQSVYIGATTAAERDRMDKSLLIQRNLEIAAEHMSLDAEYEEALDGAGDGDALRALDEQADALTAESDEIETLLFEKFCLAGGGRIMSSDEQLEAARIGQEIGNRSRSAPQPQRQSIAEETESSLSDDDNDETATADVVDASALPPSTSVERLATKRRRSDQVSEPRKKQIVSRSDSAMLQRLDSAHEETRQRRQERAEVASTQLLGRLLTFFDKYIDTDIDADKRTFSEDEVAERRAQRRALLDERRLQSTTFPFLLGTIAFTMSPPPFCDTYSLALSVDDEPIQADIRFEADGTTADNGVCVYRTLPLHDVIGFLPADMTSDQAVPHPDGTQLLPLPNHPLVALRTFAHYNNRHIVHLETSVVCRLLDTKPRRLCEVKIFLHNTFLQRTRLTSLQQRKCMLTLLRCFPPPEMTTQDTTQPTDNAMQITSNDNTTDVAETSQVEADELSVAAADIVTMDNVTIHDADDIFAVIARRRREMNNAPQKRDHAVSATSSPLPPLSPFASAASITDSTSSASSPLDTTLSTPNAPSSKPNSVQPKSSRRIIPTLITDEQIHNEIAARQWNVNNKSTLEEQVGRGVQDRENDDIDDHTLSSDDDELDDDEDEELEG